MRRQDKLLGIENVEIYNYYKERLINVALSQFSYQNLPEILLLYVSHLKANNNDFLFFL